MMSAREYRERAVRLIEGAETARDEAQAVELRSMAVEWNKLADLADRQATLRLERFPPD